MSFFAWCRREPSDDEANRSIAEPTPHAEPQVKGITLNTQVPKLTDAQRQARDAALAKYRRRLEREEKRKKKEAERAVREEARLARMRAQLESSATDFYALQNGDANGYEDRNNDDDEDNTSVRTSSTLATTMTQTTATTTVASSCAVYGRGAYMHPSHDTDGDSDAADGDEGRSHHCLADTAAKSCGSGCSGRAHARVHSTDPTQAALRERRRRQRRRHPNANTEQDAADLLNPWEGLDDMGSSSASSADAAMREVDGIVGYGGRHSRGDGGADHSDGDQSVASSVPRPPEEVLATAGRGGRMQLNRDHHSRSGGTACFNPMSVSAAVSDAGDGYVPVHMRNADRSEESEEDTVFVRGGGTGNNSFAGVTRGEGAALSGSKGGVAAQHQATSGERRQHAGPHRGSSSSHASNGLAGLGGADTTGSRAHRASLVSPGAAVKKKRWTGKDVEANAAMSGFFASADTVAYTFPVLSTPATPSALAASFHGVGGPAAAVDSGGGSVAPRRRASSAGSERAAVAAAAAAQQTNEAGRRPSSASIGHRSHSPAGYDDNSEKAGTEDLR